MATKDGKVLIKGLKNTHMVLASNIVSVQLKKPNGEQEVLGNVSSNIKDGSSIASTLNIQGTEYMFYIFRHLIWWESNWYVLILHYLANMQNFICKYLYFLVVALNT